MQYKTSVSAALRQARELIEHAERNEQEPDRALLAQLGRAYASSIRADLTNAFRYYAANMERRDMDCEELSRAIGHIGMRLSGDEDRIADSFTADEHRDFIERCMNRQRPVE